MTYRVTVSNNNYTVTNSATANTVSLSRTGGQGSKGDSISDVYIDGSNNLIVEISDSAGNVLSTENLGDIDTIIADSVSNEVQSAVTGGSNSYITVAYNVETDKIDFTVAVPMEGITDVDITGLNSGDVLSYNSGTGNWEPVTLGDTYYTESEVNTLLASKSNTSHNHNLTDLTDVDNTGKVSGDVLEWNGLTGNWEAKTLEDKFYTETETDVLLASKSNTSHTHALDDLSDVNVSVASDGWALQWNGTLNRWEASLITIAEVYGLQTTLDGKASTSHTHVKADITDFNDADYATAAHTHTLASLTDTIISSPAGDQVLRWNGLEWVNSYINLSDISDFSITGPVASGEILKWDGANWVNNTLSEAGIEPADTTILKDADIGVTVQAYSAILDATTASFTTADETKLDGIETGATADQTGAEIKVLYETELDTNAFTDAEKTKLAGIETGATADQTAAEIKTAYESNANTNAFTDANQAKLAAIESSADVTDTANVSTALNSLSIEEFSDVKTMVPSDGQVFTWDSSTASWGAETPTTGTVTSVAATVPTGFTVSGSPITSSGTLAVSYDTGYQGYTTTEAGKLAGIEAGADVTDTTNVTAAGALMDSELTSEASVKALNQGVATTDSPSFAGLTVDTDTLYVDSADNRVGIGTTSPSEALTVNGNFELESSDSDIIFAAGNSASNRMIAVDGSGDERAAVEFLGVNTNQTTEIAFHTSDTATTMAEVMRIDRDGNVGIGNSSPSVPLDVTGAVAVSSKIKVGNGVDANTNADELVVSKDGNSGMSLLCADGTGFSRVFLGSQTDTTAARIQHNENSDILAVQAKGDLVLQTGGTNDRLTVDSSGNVGIGTTSPSQALDVTGNAAVSQKLKVGTGADGSSNADDFVVSKDINNAGMSLLAADDTGIVRLYLGSQTDTTAASIRHTESNDRLFVQSSGDLYFQTGGNNTRATLNTSGDLDIDGALSKGSGSFKIDHPLLPETHHLVHSFIEGPQADNLYRGRVDLVGGTATVNLDTAGRMTDGTFVALNGNVQCFTTNEQGWTAVRGSVSGNILTIEAQDATCTDTVSWMVIGERKDQHMIDTHWTDAEGRVITEPEKIDDTQTEAE